MTLVLCATPDAERRDLLAFALSRTGCLVRTSRTWPDTLAMLATQPVALALLDEALPAGAADTLHTALRRFGSATSLIVLAAHPSEAGEVACLQAGADDYVPPSVSVSVVLRRVQAILRRRGMPATETRPAAYRVGDVAFDPDRCEVRLGRHAVRLTRTQSALLTMLCRHPGRVLPTPLLAAQIPHARTNALGGSLALKAHMSHLRAKSAFRTKIRE